MHELDAQLQQPQSEGNLLRGIAFAFLFSLGGVVLWILLGGLAEIVSAWVAFLIGYLAALGWYYGKGPKNMKVRIPALIVVYVVSTLIAIISAYAIMLARYNLGMSFMWEAIEYDIVILSIFSVIGLAYVPFSHLSMPDHIQKMREQRMGGQPENPWGETQTQGQDPIGFTDSTQLENPTTDDSPQNPT